MPLDQFIAEHGADLEADPVVQFHFESGIHIATAKAATAIGANLAVQRTDDFDFHPLAELPEALVAFSDYYGSE